MEFPLHSPLEPLVALVLQCRALALLLLVIHVFESVIRIQLLVVPEQLTIIVMLATLQNAYLLVLITITLRKVVIKHRRVLTTLVVLVVAAQPLAVVYTLVVHLEVEALEVVVSIQVEPLEIGAKYL